ncbi:DUF2147 domain-containing protein [Sneathiella sp. P13V-1]|uniref:DUF2147 domain-containing protein n=1 Tax=Sneathiella sp. P13V-1 TaxID=2697366 RepID=UPI00187B9F84|nr:DUF2147 domain-containing protein [Sneathiella sp. P13V-1]MBE7637153.1 DUF2147 domain-containing protein [Sneathiella sp. P13V-1]
MKKLGLAIGLVALSATFASASESSVLGQWKTEGDKSIVEISKCGDNKYCGKILSLKEPLDQSGQPKKDINNQDDNKKSQPIVGLQILSNLEKASDTLWEDGDIYNPEDGNTYNAEMSLKDANTLEVKGCFLFICKAQTWQRNG